MEVLACRITGEDRWCRRCGGQGICCGTVVRRLAHVPYGWRPTILHVSVRRYRCPECAHVWRQVMSQAADPRAKLSRGAMRWALTGLVVHHLTVARIADVLAVSWNTANTAILGEGQRILAGDPDRFEGVRVIGVDEHAPQGHGRVVAEVIEGPGSRTHGSGDTTRLHPHPTMKSHHFSPHRGCRGLTCFWPSRCTPLESS